MGFDDNVKETECPEQLTNASELIDRINTTRNGVIDWLNDFCCQLAELLYDGPRKTVHFEMPPLYITDHNGILKGKKPQKIQLPGGETFEVTTWRKAAEIILKDCRSSPERLQILADRCNMISGNSRVILSSDPENMDKPIKISDGMYFESYYDTETLFDVMQKHILKPVGYDYSSILIYTRDMEFEVGSDISEMPDENMIETEEEQPWTAISM